MHDGSRRRQQGRARMQVVVSGSFKQPCVIQLNILVFLLFQQVLGCEGGGPAGRTVARVE
jgi:hypothetical protein